MNSARYKLKEAAAALAVCALGGALLAAPEAAAQGFARGVQLCLQSVLPALFPLFVVCNLLAGSPAAAWLARPFRPLARRLGLGGDAAPLALLLSWLGGYAVCARLVRQLRDSGQLTAAQAGLLLQLGCCSGPGFVVGCLGGLLLGSVRLGVLLYGLQLAANLLSAACLALLPPRAEQPSGRPPAPQAPAALSLPGAISQAVDSALQVGGCTVFFSTVTAVLCTLLPAFPLVQPLLAALLEISGGCAEFAALGGAAALYGLCFCLSLPGLSVFCQIAVLAGNTVSMWRFLFSRLLHLFWLQVLMHLCARLLPGVAATASTLHARVIPMQRLPADAAVICFVFLCCTLYKLHKIHYNKR